MNLRIVLNDEKNKYIAIYKQIKTQIIKGELKENEKLPSKRVLKETLHVSINTIMNAYNLLLDEEYIYAVEKKGYFVSPNRFYQYQEQNEVQEEELTYQYDFSSENVSKDLFPFYTFKKVTQDILTTNQDIWLRKAPNKGDIELRKTICSYLYQNKGMNISFNNIIIVSSLTNTLEIIDSLININTVGVEEYSYQQFAKYYQKKRKEIIYLPSDDHGPIIDKENIDLIYTTPYNQFPLGIVMSSKRKNEIINSSIKYILEDDYDLDILNKKKVVSTLYSLNPGKVFYHGSFSHSICPGIRISYLVLPNEFVNKIENTKSSNISSLDQRILEKFIRDGHYFRHLNKLKKEINRKREFIYDLLKDEEYIDVNVNNNSFIIDLKEDYDIEELNNLFKKEKIKIKYLQDFSLKKDKRLILNFSSLRENETEQAIMKFLKCIKIIIKKY